MKFLKYKRPNMEILKDQWNLLIDKFEKEENVEKQNNIILKINELRSEFESMERIAYIRYTIDTMNAEYEKEQNFFNENKPIYEEWVSKYYGSLVHSKYKEALKEKWGEQLFHIAEMKIKTFSPEIIEDLKQENQLMSEYTKLLGGAEIYFEGKIRNLSQLRPFEMSTDPFMRKRASEEKYQFFHKNEGKFDIIYDKLVKVRTQIARKLGYENFVDLGYKRMLRWEYDSKMIKKLRDQIKDYIVPLAVQLREEQRIGLGLEKLKYYDENLMFKDGNPEPKKDVNRIIENGKRMYRELSEETRAFFNHMLENQCMDLVSKNGKSPGGYCTYISKFKTPFIFSNFNGTVDDIDVLTHEAGHAFQMYESRRYILPEYQFPTLDACEIHSMSMEFFTWPWMDLFFKVGDLYRLFHLKQSLLFIPYGALVDEFQHFVYENPTITPDERKKMWRRIEKKYLPYRDYDGNEYLKGGGYWHQQGHIFKNPFYYIDYVLAGICAFQFWEKSRKDWNAAWKDYLALCRVGGSHSFLNLVKIGGLESPFNENCISSITKEIKNWLHVKES